jgi:NADH-quinone oxidoreductase subunit N
MPFAAGLWEALQRDTPLLFPQLILILTATLMLWPGDLFVPRDEKHRWAWVTVAALVVAWIFVYFTPHGLGFNDMFEVDGISKGFMYLILAAGIITVFLSQLQLDALGEQTVEYYALLLFSISGMMCLVGATDLVSIYFSLELMALCVYILVAYLRTHERSIEAGVKYFLLGAFSSGILLFGISLVFAAAGGVTTNLVKLNDALALAPKSSGPSTCGRPTPTTAPPPPSPRSCPWRRRLLPWPPSCGCSAPASTGSVPTGSPPCRSWPPPA